MSIIEDRVCKKIQDRAQHGLKKYGVTLERDDLTEEQWLVHLQEELMDACGYIEALLYRLAIIKSQIKHDELSKQEAP